MKGRQILIEPLAEGGHAAALMIDGRLEDLLIDPPAGESVPRPEAIYRAIPARPMKGTGGTMVDLGVAGRGFLRATRPPAPGASLLVQAGALAEPGKAPPVSTKILLKGRFAILTPAAPGRNVARSLRDPDLRAGLAALADTAMADAPCNLGLILRSAAACADAVGIRNEIAALRADLDRLEAAAEGPPALLRPGPGAAAEALRDWLLSGDQVIEGPGALADRGVWEDVADLRRPVVRLGAAALAIEPTRALVAVDVNTGGDLSPAAALKANLAAAAELPRQLRLRGLGGQITVDFAPLAKSERRRVETALAAALRSDGIETAIVGWTPLGHLELNRKRTRPPLV